MGVKRAHNEVHPSRRPQVPEGSSSKKRKVNPHPHRKLESSNHAINPIKSRIRSLERLLKHRENLPADVRLNHERELASCRYELDEAEAEKRKSDLIGKYHMVRFFDRQKATRKLKQTKRKLAEAKGTEEEGVWRRKVHEGEVDVNYAQYYPLDQAYSALYPTKGKKGKKAATGEDGEEAGSGDDAKQEERQGDPDMWKVVEICMAQGKLDKLRNGKLMKAAASGPKNDDDLAARERKQDKKQKDKKAATTKAEKNKSVGEDKKVQEEDEDSDGGFFE